MTALVLPLESVRDVAAAGGKARGLARAAALGHRVPRGFVVLAGALEDAAARRALHEARAALGPGPVIVRSSAIGEDGALASFAGLLDSVPGEPDLERALRTVWASRWSARALAYERARGVRIEGVAAIVQELVPAAVSGVLFTRDPTGGDGSIVEWIAGHGADLVLGRVSPSRARVTAGRVERLDAASAPELPDALLAELAALGAALERGLGAAQDVEWALDASGALHVLQARPITGPTETFTNANLKENYPEPVTPLLAGVARLGYEHYFRNLGLAFGVSRRRIASMRPALEALVATHAGRLYYNLTNIHAAVRLLPLGERIARSFDDYVGAPRAPGGTPPPPARELLELPRVVLTAAWRFARIRRHVARFERTVTRFAERTHPSRLGARSLAELREDLREFLAIRTSWTDAALADMASMITSALMKRVLARRFPAEPALAGSLLKGLADLVSGEPAVALYDLSRVVRENRALRALFERASGPELLAALPRHPVFAARFAEALEAWGFRGSGELLLTRRSFQEDPAALLELVRSYVALEGPHPREAIARKAAEREAETRRVLAALGRGRLTFGLLLRATQGSLALRERVRLKQALLYARLRRIALALGERLVASGALERAEDVFFLTHEEALAAPPDARALVARRRAEHAAFLEQEPPEVLVLPRGARWRGASGPSSADGPGPSPAAGELEGLAACGGVVTGAAAVLEDVREAAGLARGSILVVKQTDPGWAPALFLAGGLVVECGGLLSHGAILAREFGVPAVVGVKDAMKRIAPGARVTVDGDRGRVRAG